jgi:hypothetical protein
MIILAGLAALGSSLGPIPSRSLDGRGRAHGGSQSLTGSRLIRRATAAATVQPELRDYAGAASALFGTYRVPGALFAGASAGAAASLLSTGYVAWAIPHVAAYARATFR